MNDPTNEKLWAALDDYAAGTITPVIVPFRAVEPLSWFGRLRFAFKQFGQTLSGHQLEPVIYQLDHDIVPESKSSFSRNH